MKIEEIKSYHRTVCENILFGMEISELSKNLLGHCGFLLQRIEELEGEIKEYWSPNIERLNHEVEKWKQGCQDLADGQDDLEALIKELDDGIEKHRQSYKPMYWRECDFKLYKLLRRNESYKTIRTPQK